MCKSNVTTCCGFIPLRFGCMAIAGLMLLPGIGLVVVKPVIFYLELVIPIIIFEVLTWVTLLIGAIINHAILVVISLVGLILLFLKNIILMALLSNGFSFFLSMHPNPHPSGGYEESVVMFVLWMTGCVVTLGLAIYFGMVIYSFYRELKFGGQGVSYNA